MILVNFFLSLYCWSVIVSVTVVLGGFAGAVSFVSSKIAHKSAKLWGKVILKLCFVKVNVFGENDDDQKNSVAHRFYIITANHQSYFDIFILIAYLPIEFKFIAKKSLFNIPILGISMKRLGYISIDRENLRSALRTVKEATEAIKNKTSILIFPEGTRSLDGTLNSFKKGALNMFLRQKEATILPVVIKGSINILKKNSLAVHPGKTVELHILKSVAIKGGNPNNPNDGQKADQIEIKATIDKIIEGIETETRNILEGTDY